MISLNTPTKLTFFRITLVPLLVLFFYIPFCWGPLVCVLIFIIAALTDWLDGFFARKLQQTTKFGGFLDPVADKIIVLTVLVLITEYYHTWWITLPALIIISREIIISSLREWMAEVDKRNCVTVSLSGKIKTVVQMGALIGMLWHPNIQIKTVSVILLYFATILTFWSMLKYLFVAWKNLN